MIGQLGAQVQSQVADILQLARSPGALGGSKQGRDLLPRKDDDYSTVYSYILLKRPFDRFDMDEIGYFLDIHGYIIS